MGIGFTYKALRFINVRLDDFQLKESLCNEIQMFGVP